MPSLQKELRSAITAAKAAGTLIKQHVGKAVAIRYKGAINIVTEVDEKAGTIVLRIAGNGYQL